MRVTRSWVLIVSTLAAIAIVGAAVAKDRDDDDKGSEVAYCIDNKQAYARYVVVKDAYQRGELGTRREVVRSVDPRARGAIFRPNGDLRLWTGMNRSGKHEFLQWATSGRVYAKTEAAQTRATDAITREDCE